MTTIERIEEAKRKLTKTKAKSKKEAPVVEIKKTEIPVTPKQVIVVKSPVPEAPVNKPDPVPFVEVNPDDKYIKRFVYLNSLHANINMFLRMMVDTDTNVAAIMKRIGGYVDKKVFVDLQNHFREAHGKVHSTFYENNFDSIELESLKALTKDGTNPTSKESVIERIDELFFKFDTSLGVLHEAHLVCTNKEYFNFFIELKALLRLAGNDYKENQVEDRILIYEKIINIETNVNLLKTTFKI